MGHTLFVCHVAEVAARVPAQFPVQVPNGRGAVWIEQTEDVIISKDQEVRLLYVYICKLLERANDLAPSSPLNYGSRTEINCVNKEH